MSAKSNSLLRGALTLFVEREASESESACTSIEDLACVKDLSIGTQVADEFNDGSV